MGKSIAVVVSYNRQALLAECIHALKNQTRKPDAILVINNGSTDNTEDWLNSQKDIFHITQQNIGSGGGFNTGITWAYKNGYSWIWCMDDDGYPKNDALENLLKHELPQRSLLNCAVLNKENRKTFVWNTNNYKSIDDVNEKLIPGIGHPFNGTLIHRSIVEKVGVPNASLFLWGDETEYYYRIVNQHKIPVYTVADSIHYHPASAYSYKKDWDLKTSWKMYFYVRNRFHVHRAKFSNRSLALLHYLVFILAFAGIIIVYQKTDKLRKLNFMIWPLADALKNDFSVTPPTILNKLNQQNAGSYPFRLLAPVRYLYNAIFITGASGRSKTATA
jgi:rhamnopyranosyl-N-acetylglucosaminyl-diphospho-decaprenol beta-1,3/1,4-galactofuranosyltransferase